MEKEFIDHHKHKSGEHPDGEGLDYSYMGDGIYVGTNQCCVVGILEVLKKEGITADISLEGEHVDAPYGIEFYIWLPTMDGMSPSRDQLSLGIKTLDELVGKNKKIYVHCKNGHGRSTTMLAAYYMHKGKSLEEAVEFIKLKRPGAHLNSTQREALQKLQ